jgi:hypothetical protein
MAKNLLKERLQELAGVIKLTEASETPTFVIKKTSQEIGNSITNALKQIPNDKWSELRSILDNFPQVTEDPKTSSLQRGRTGWDNNLKSYEHINKFIFRRRS